MENIPLLEPRNLDSIRYIITAISSHDNFSEEELENYVNSKNHEFDFSSYLLFSSSIIDVLDNSVIITIQDIDFIKIYREIFLFCCKQNQTLRKFVLQIGINRSGNYRRKGNIDQLLRNSNLYDIDDSDVSFWWFQVKEFDREASHSENNGNPLTGYSGEFLTVEFEKNRLNGSNQIEWVSLNPNGDRFGYDIESLREEHGQKMLIEVKSSKNNFSDARIHLTYNEYKVLNKNIRDYVFYLWWKVNNDTGCGPLIVEGSLMAEKLTSLMENEISFTDSLIIPFLKFGEGFGVDET